MEQLGVGVGRLIVNRDVADQSAQARINRHRHVHLARVFVRNKRPRDLRLVKPVIVERGRKAIHRLADRTVAEWLA